METRSIYGNYKNKKINCLYINTYIIKEIFGYWAET